MRVCVAKEDTTSSSRRDKATVTYWKETIETVKAAEDYGRLLSCQRRNCKNEEHKAISKACREVPLPTNPILMALWQYLHLQLMY